MFTRLVASFVFLAVVVMLSAGCTAMQKLEASGAVCKGYTADAVPLSNSATQDAAAQKMTLDEAMSRIEAADGWTRHPALDLPRHPAEKYLKGWVIVLDPGHGGKSLEVDGWKMGPTGVREAEMNLRVGLMLRRLLEDAGAIVAMTRESETSDIADDRIGEYDHGAPAPGSSSDAPQVKNTLQLRAEFANNFPRPEGARPNGLADAEGDFRGRGADLFISIHHNASSSPKSNYTTVWFHGPAEDATVELDAARHLAREIGRALRTDVGLTSPVMSDRQMYEKGFGVLRHATVPAVLCESSFYTNLEEEQRLNNPGYLIREAYAMYVGLCELAYSGRPTQSLPEVEVVAGELVVTAVLDDGLPDWWGHELGRTLPGTVHAEIEGEPAAVSLQMDAQAGVVTATARGRVNWEVKDVRVTNAVTLEHVNFLKAHNWPQRYAVDLKWEPGAEAPEVVAVRPLGASRPGLLPDPQDSP